MKMVQYKSPAKINLGLNIISKRSDGFHNLETIFYPLLLYDVLKFEKKEKLNFNSNSESLNSIKNNLILKALRLIEDHSGKKFTVKIELDKNIPIGGGLGGGSSNAAVTLKAINSIYNLNYDYALLKKLALKVGSDVPYFLNPIPSFAENRGDKITNLPFTINYPILLVNPGINISTKWAFSKIVPSVPIKNLKQIISTQQIDFELMKKYVRNDFEDVVSSDYPLLQKLKNELYKSGAKFALMSGTGSTVFGIFDNLQIAKTAQEKFNRDYFTYLNNPFLQGSIT